MPDPNRRALHPVLPGADGPQNCGLVYLVQSDPELRDQLAAKRAEHRAGVSMAEHDTP